MAMQRKSLITPHNFRSDQTKKGQFVVVISNEDRTHPSTIAEVPHFAIQNHSTPLPFPHSVRVMKLRRHNYGQKHACLICIKIT